MYRGLPAFYEKKKVHAGLKRFEVSTNENLLIARQVNQKPNLITLTKIVHFIERLYVIVFIL